MNELTEGHRNLLETIYDVLRTQDRWPPYRYLEDFLDSKFDVDIGELAGTMSRNLTTLPPPGYPANDQQEIQLTIEGLRYVELPGAADDVDLFFRVFCRFVDEQKRVVPTIDAQPNPCLTTNGLSMEWSIHPTVLRRVFWVIALEPWSASRTPIGDGSDIRVCAHPRTLRKFRKAENLDKYLELRRAYFQPSRPTPVTVPAVVRAATAMEQDAASAPVPVPTGPPPAKEWDAFISHAGADKESFVRGLADTLKAAGLKIWYDDFELKVGDSLRQKIDEGLARSKYGIVVLSPNFFERQWPQWELDGLAGRQNAEGRKVILPVLHNITVEQVREKSSPLAGLVAVSSDRGTPHVAKELLKAMDFPPPLEVPIQASQDQS